MATTKIDGLRQIQDQSIKRELLELDFLKGSNLDLTNGAQDATIVGLAASTTADGAVNKGQMEAFVASQLTGGMTYKGQLDASDATGATLDGSIQGDFWYISVAGTLDGISYAVGDHLVVNADITDFDVDGSGKVDKIDNVNVQSELDATQSGAGLNADGSYTPDDTADYISIATSLKNADSLLDDQIKANADAIAAIQGVSEVYGEEFAPVANGTTYTLANFPIVSGSLRVYINGMRGASGDYSVNEATGLVTFVDQYKGNKYVIVFDYKY